MTLLAITVIGHDRPGIVAEVTAALAGRGGNLEDSSMTLLRGHFAWTLIVDAPAAPADLHADLAYLADSGLAVTVMPLPEDASEVAAGARRCILSVHGADTVGIVAAVTGPVAAAGGSITDLQTRLARGLYVLIAEIDLPPGAAVEELGAQLKDVGRAIGVEVTLRAADEDLL